MTSPYWFSVSLVTNGVVAGAYKDVLGVASPAHVAVAKTTVVDILKAAIFLDGENGYNYNQLKDYLGKDLSNGTDNYPTTVEHAVSLLNTYKIKF